MDEDGGVACEAGAVGGQEGKRSREHHVEADVHNAQGVMLMLMWTSQLRANVINKPRSWSAFSLLCDGIRMRENSRLVSARLRHKLRYEDTAGMIGARPWETQYRSAERGSERRKDGDK